MGAHGGTERRKQFETVSAQLAQGGVLWCFKHQDGILAEVKVRVNLRREWVSHHPFPKPNLRTSVEPKESPLK
jgi:hypothetical protein